MQIEAFNGVTLSDTEFGKVMNHLTRSNMVFEKAEILRDRKALERDYVRPDGSASQSSQPSAISISSMRAN